MSDDRNKDNWDRAVARLVAGIGFTTLLAQILLVREANVWLRGNECIIAGVVACWLAWMAVGNAVGYYASRNTTGSWIARGWILSVAASVIELVLLRCCWPWTGGTHGMAVGLGKAAILSLALTALPCVLAGSALGNAMRWCEGQTGRTVAWLYLRETLGAVVAGVLATFVLVPLERWWLALAILIVVPVVSLRTGMVRTVCAAALLVAVWCANGLFEHRAQQIASTFTTGSIVLDLDTPRERITVTAQGNEHAFYIDGRFCGSSMQPEDAEETSWYAALSRRTSSNALVVGFAYNGLLRELAQKSIATTVLDEQRNYLDRLTPFLLAEDRAAITSRYAHVVAADCRAFMRDNRASFDLVIQNDGVPESYAVSRLYSTEWFTSLSRILGRDGVLMVVLPSSAGYVPDDLARMLARARATLSGVFNHVTLIPASSVLLLATNGDAVPADEQYWLDQWHGRGTNTIWFNVASIADALNELHRAQFERALARYPREALHRDLIPTMYGDALRYSEARFGGAMHSLLGSLYASPARLKMWCWIVVALIVCSTVAVRRMRRARLWLAMNVVAAAGFVAEMTVVIRFVVERGSVYYALGMLFASFMLGLAAAAWLLQHRGSRSLRVPAAVGLAMVLLLAARLPWPSAPAGIMATACLLNALAAFCVGACFTILARDAAETRGGGVMLYIADVCGALFGGILFSIVVAPVLGFGMLAVLLALVVLVTVL